MDGSAASMSESAVVTRSHTGPRAPQTTGAVAALAGHVTTSTVIGITVAMTPANRAAR
jgi:hypothetical protein